MNLYSKGRNDYLSYYYDDDLDSQNCFSSPRFYMGIQKTISEGRRDKNSLGIGTRYQCTKKNRVTFLMFAFRSVNFRYMYGKTQHFMRQITKSDRTSY